jgi:hypothetical protein
MVDPNAPPGCLIYNTGIELDLCDPVISKFVKDYFANLAKTLQTCLESSINKGILAATTDLTALSIYVATEFRTALMLAKSGHNRCFSR